MKWGGVEMWVKEEILDNLSNPKTEERGKHWSVSPFYLGCALQPGKSVGSDVPRACASGYH